MKEDVGQSHSVSSEKDTLKSTESAEESEKTPSIVESNEYPKMTGTPTEKSVNIEQLSQTPLLCDTPCVKNNFSEQTEIPFPIVHSSSELPRGLSSRLFDYLSYFPVIPLTLALILQVVFTLDARELWYSDEIRHADAFTRYLAGNNWFVLSMNGELYPDKPPLYFLFLLGLYKILPAYFTYGYSLFFTGTAVSSILFLWSTLILGRSVARFDGKILFTSGIVLTSSLYFVGLVHYARMDLLFSAVIVLSLTCFYRASIKERAFLFMLAGYFFAGVACLIKGPLGIAIPFFSTLVFCIWQQGSSFFLRTFGIIIVFTACSIGSYTFWSQLPFANQLGSISFLSYLFYAVPFVSALICLFKRKTIAAAFCYVVAGLVCLYFEFPMVGIATFIFGFFTLTLMNASRLLRADSIAGATLFLILISTWAIGVILETGGTETLLESFFQKQIIARGLDTFHHAEPWHYYLMRLPLAFFPWTLLLFCLPYKKIMQRNSVGTAAFFHPASGSGVAFLWIVAITSIFLLSLLSGKILIYYLPAFPAVSLLAGKSLLELGKKGAYIFRHLTALFYLISGISLTIAALMLFGTIPTPLIKGIPAWRLAFTGGFFIVSGVFILTAASLWWVLKSNRVEGVCLVILCFTTLASFSTAKYVSPAFNAVLSPKLLAESIKEYLDQGYEVYTYKDYGGTYSYYSGATIPPCTSLDRLAELVEEKEKTGIVLPEKQLKKGAQLPSCFTEVKRQWIETKEYVLFVCSLPPKKEKETPALVPVDHFNEQAAAEGEHKNAIDDTDRASISASSEKIH